MTICNHSEWLRLSGGPEITIYDEDRMNRILQELHNPFTQKPSLLLFIGRRDKDIAIRNLFPNNNISRCRKRNGGVVNLRIDSNTINSDYPILFADSNPCQFISSPPAVSYCHEKRSYPISWGAASPGNLFNVIHSRLLCLFADVICLFCDEVWGESEVIRCLGTWATLGSTPLGSSGIRPRVVIVIKGDNASPTYNVLQLEDLTASIRQEEISRFFSSITILRLAHTSISSVSRHRPLREAVQRHLEEIRYLRQSLRCLYSAVHLNYFFQMAVQHTANTCVLPFNFLRVSRLQTGLPADFEGHFSVFVRSCALHGIPQVVIASLIASSILLDAYPPRMHRKAVSEPRRNMANSVRLRPSHDVHLLVQEPLRKSPASKQQFHGVYGVHITLHPV